MSVFCAKNCSFLHTTDKIFRIPLPPLLSPKVEVLDRPWSVCLYVSLAASICQRENSTVDNIAHWIKGQDQRSRLGLGSQFETRSVGSRSWIETAFKLIDTSRDKLSVLDHFRFRHAPSLSLLIRLVTAGVAVIRSHNATCSRPACMWLESRQFVRVLSLRRSTVTPRV